MSENGIKQFKYSKIVTMDSPYDKDSRKIYHLFANVQEIPVGLPTEVNPREVNNKKAVYKKISQALTADNDSFFVNNRGILISAKNVKIDNINRVVTIDIGDGSDLENSLYGVLDGGHTYDAILNNRDSIAEDAPQYVHIEIMTDVINIDELASARNTSVQVSDKAIAELANKFGFVKEAIKNESYAKKIAYRENEDKELDAIDLVRLMFSMNIYKYSADSIAQPIPAYSSKSQVLKDYLAECDTDQNPYEKIAKLLPEITKIYDAIEKDMAQAYLENNANGKFGKVKGVEPLKKKGKTKFYNLPLEYQISQGLIFPILAAFRALIVENEENQLLWAVDPIVVWKKIKGKLVDNTINMSRALGQNPQSAGKSATLWSQNYDAVKSVKLEMMLAQLQKNTI